MEHVLCFAIILAIAAALMANIVSFKKALDCVRQKKPVAAVCKRLRVLFGVFLALWLAGGVLIPRLLGGPYGFTQPLLQTVFSGIAGYWVISLFHKNDKAL